MRPTGSVSDDTKVGRRSTHQRYELLKALAKDAKRHLILVTATPHSGKEEVSATSSACWSRSWRRSTLTVPTAAPCWPSTSCSAAGPTSASSSTKRRRFRRTARLSKPLHADTGVPDTVRQGPGLRRRTGTDRRRQRHPPAGALVVRPRPPARSVQARRPRPPRHCAPARPPPRRPTQTKPTPSAAQPSSTRPTTRPSRRSTPSPAPTTPARTTPPPRSARRLRLRSRG